MGNTDNGFTIRFKEQYKFIQIIDDRNFGTVKIYRKVEINYDYIMVMERHIDN